jgi:PAS domain S-box-containing protein
MKISLEQKLISVFLVFLLGIFVIGFMAYRNNIALDEANAWVQHTEDVLLEADKVFSLTRDLGGERAYNSTHDKEFIEPFENAEKNVFYQMGILKDLTRDNPVQQQRVDSIAVYTRNRIDLARHCFELTGQNKMAEAEALINSKQGKFWNDKIRETVTALQSSENNMLAERKATNNQKIQAFNNIIIALFSVLLLLLAATFIAIRHNLTARNKLENELGEANNFLFSILENIPNMIFVKDAKNLKFVRFNRAGEKLLGQSRENLIGKNDYDFFPKPQADFFTSKDREVIARGEVQDIAEEPIQTPGGERWLHTKKIPINDENGRPLYLLGISEDITEHKNNLDEIKQLNSELGKTINQLLQANKEMEAFTYSVSHDLRAPLRIIDGFGEILLKDYGTKLDEEGAKTLRVIMSNAKHMGQLIDDLLNLSRLGRAKLSVKYSDMQEIVEEVVEAIKVMAPNVNAEIKIGFLKAVECDPSLMRQVWMNLISNAIKYSRKKEHPLIEIACNVTDDNVVYYIKDNGVGFDMKYSHKLFGVFQRLHKTSEFEGTGVGLALVQRIIIKHGGNIWADSKPDEGAVFYFTLSHGHEAQNQQA